LNVIGFVRDRKKINAFPHFRSQKVVHARKEEGIVLLHSMQKPPHGVKETRKCASKAGIVIRPSTCRDPVMA
jgi:hypothetical protein